MRAHLFVHRSSIQSPQYELWAVNVVKWGFPRRSDIVTDLIVFLDQCWFLRSSPISDKSWSNEVNDINGVQKSLYPSLVHNSILKNPFDLKGNRARKYHLIDGVNEKPILKLLKPELDIIRSKSWNQIFVEIVSISLDYGFFSRMPNFLDSNIAIPDFNLKSSIVFR